MEFARMELYPAFFDKDERSLLHAGCFDASSFLFKSGVCGMRLKSDRGELVVLPFQGQQIWRACFDGHDLTMKTAFDEPVATDDYLKTYGGFLIHCGATAMGVPTKQDSHPLHGELPNRIYSQAYLALGEDQDGKYLAFGGKTRYTVSFETNYSAEPEIRLYAGATTARVSMKLTNLRSAPMEYMYLCHINFLPVDGAQLVYSAPADPAHVYAHIAIPERMPADKAAALRQYMEQINRDPRVHHLVDQKSQIYDPEIVMTIKYLADRQGYAHSMAILPEGGAYYVSHRTKELPLGLRWISRTGDEDALGMVLPSTAEHLGLADARKNGMMKILGAGQSIVTSIEVGYLEAGQVAKMKTIIDLINEAG